MAVARGLASAHGFTLACYRGRFCREPAAGVIVVPG